MNIDRVYRSVAGMIFAGTLAFTAPAQNLFVAYNGNSNGVYEVTPDGSQSNFATGFGAPYALALDRTGDLFVADIGSNNIVEITPRGIRSIFAAGVGSPYGLAFDSAGDLFASDYGSSMIYEFTNCNGTLTSNLNVFAFIGLNGPTGLAFDSAGDLFEADFASGNINEFTNYNGTLTTNVTVFAATGGSPAGLAFNGSGVLFVANDQAIGSVIEITAGRPPNTFASGLNQPLGLAFNAAGNLFVANQAGTNITAITPEGTPNAFVTEATLPAAVAFAPAPQLQATAPNNIFQLNVLAPSPYYSTVVQASTDLINWAAVCTNTPPFTFTDTAAAQFPCRFYRALLLP